MRLSFLRQQAYIGLSDEGFHKCDKFLETKKLRNTENTLYSCVFVLSGSPGSYKLKLKQI
jgi:hypothetical protein